MVGRFAGRLGAIVAAEAVAAYATVIERRARETFGRFVAIFAHVRRADMVRILARRLGSVVT